MANPEPQTSSKNRTGDSTTRATPTGFYITAALLYLLDFLWLWVLAISINERVQYGTAETGWGMLAAIITLSAPLIAFAIVNMIILLFTRTRTPRLIIGFALLLSLFVAVGIFGFDAVAAFFGAHADGSPASGHTLLDDPATY